jgi:[amino group carrier protein]-lysine/ornithine hydrolase
VTSSAPAKAAVDRDLALDLLRRMLEVPSPPCEERALAELLVEAMSELGLDAGIDAAGNAIGETGAGDGPAVYLVGHLDTAPGLVPVRDDGRRLFGRGAADAKGPLAALVLAASQARDAPGRIVVAGAVEEETPASRGAHHLVATLDQPDALIVGEPSGWSCVTLGYKGKVDVVYRVSRPATHPTNPVAKATEVAAAFWADVLSLVEGWERRGDDRRPGHAAFDRLAVTLVALRGDLEEAELELCFRTPVGFDTDGLLSLLGELGRGGELELVARVAATRAGRRSPVVRALTDAIRRGGGEPRLKVKTATSDINVLAEHWSVPMATYGPGDSRLDHANDEHIDTDEYLNGIRVLTDAVRRLTYGREETEA